MHEHIHGNTDDGRPEHTHHYMHANQLHEHRTRFAERNHLYIPNTTCLRFTSGRDTFFDIEHHTAKYAQVWNSIPSEIREEPSKNILSEKLKLYLLEKQLHLYH